MTGELILIVEDNDSLRAGLCEMLTEEGFEILQAQDAQQAISTLEKVTPELILSDIMMPGIDGFDLFTTIRSRPELVSIPFIFLTARSDPADFMRGRLLGADDYLTKPVSKEELVTAIRSRLGRYSQVKIAQLQLAYQASLTMLADAIESRTPSTSGHIERVLALSRLLAEHLGWNDRAINQLAFGAILHDLGKLTIPEEIIFKKEPLTDEEWTEIRRHPSIGSEMIHGIPFLSEVVPLIRHHHERWDGSGYPEGLSGADIPAGARILSLADAFDTMASGRVYAPTPTLEQAYEEILQRSGSQFDPLVVDAFKMAWSTGKVHQLFKDLSPTDAKSE